MSASITLMSCEKHVQNSWMWSSNESFQFGS